jgi:hypothetical protein
MYAGARSVMTEALLRAGAALTDVHGRALAFEELYAELGDESIRFAVVAKSKLKFGNTKPEEFTVILALTRSRVIVAASRGLRLGDPVATLDPKQVVSFSLSTVQDCFVDQRAFSSTLFLATTARDEPYVFKGSPNVEPFARAVLASVDEFDTSR